MGCKPSKDKLSRHANFDFLGLFNRKKGCTACLLAFTLSEVLITLGIIGIVAAITIPTLMKKHQEEVTITQLKKVYSDFFQAFKLAEAEYGTVDTWAFPKTKFRLPDTTVFAETYIYPYLKVDKKCGVSFNGCTKVIRKTASGDTGSVYLPSSRTITAKLSNGMLVWIWTYSYVPDGRNLIYAGIGVDINGDKPPNTVAKDIFYFSIAPKKGFSFSYSDYTLLEIVTANDGGCSTTATNIAGSACGVLIQRNHWKIPTKSEYIKFGGNAAKYPW